MDLISHRGFTLLEVVIAIGLLAVAALAIAGTLGAAVQYSGAAAVARLALTEAEALADTADRSALYPSGWRDVGGVGPDHLPGTADDRSIWVGGGLHCRRRVTPEWSGGVEWLWIEVDCASPGPGAAPGTIASRPGGKLGRKIQLVAAR